MPEFTRKDKALIIGAIDEALRSQLGFDELLTEEQDAKILALYNEVIDTTSPRDIRESLTALGRRLYSEVFPE